MLFQPTLEIPANKYLVIFRKRIGFEQVFPITSTDLFFHLNYSHQFMRSILLSTTQRNCSDLENLSYKSHMASLLGILMLVNPIIPEATVLYAHKCQFILFKRFIRIKLYFYVIHVRSALTHFHYIPIYTRGRPTNRKLNHTDDFHLSSSGNSICICETYRLGNVRRICLFALQISSEGTALVHSKDLIRTYVQNQQKSSDSYMYVHTSVCEENVIIGDKKLNFNVYYDGWSKLSGQPDF